MQLRVHRLDLAPQQVYDMLLPCKTCACSNLACVSVSHMVLLQARQAKQMSEPGRPEPVEETPAEPTPPEEPAAPVEVGS